jgi:CRP-like cAMP-binding protein
MPLNEPGNRLLNALPQDERATLLESSEHVELPFRTQLYEQGGEMAHVIFLTSGMASEVMTLTDGSGVEACLLARSEMVGLETWLGASTSHTSVFMQAAGSGFRLPADKFLAIAAASPQLGVRLRRQAGATIRALAQTTACNLRHESTTRLARWLRSVQVRLTTNELPLTHELLSIMLGVRRPTVSLSASELRDEGLIAYRRGSISILDTDRLGARACECGDVVDELYRE